MVFGNVVKLRRSETTIDPCTLPRSVRRHERAVRRVAVSRVYSASRVTFVYRLVRVRNISNRRKLASRRTCDDFGKRRTCIVTYVFPHTPTLNKSHRRPMANRSVSSVYVCNFAVAATT